MRLSDGVVSGIVEIEIVLDITEQVIKAICLALSLSNYFCLFLSFSRLSWGSVLRALPPKMFVSLKTVD